MKDRIKQFVQEHKNEVIIFTVGVLVGTAAASNRHRVTGVELIGYENGDQSINVYKANGLHSRFNKVNNS